MSSTLCRYTALVTINRCSRFSDCPFEARRAAVLTNLRGNDSVAEPGSSDGTDRRDLNDPIIPHLNGEIVATTPAPQTGDVIDPFLPAHEACLNCWPVIR